MYGIAAAAAGRHLAFQRCSMSRKMLAVLGRRVHSWRRGERITTPGRARTSVSNRTRPRHGGLTSHPSLSGQTTSQVSLSSGFVGSLVIERVLGILLCSHRSDLAPRSSLERCTFRVRRPRSCSRTPSQAWLCRGVLIAATQGWAVDAVSYSTLHRDARSVPKYAGACRKRFEAECSGFTYTRE